MKKFLMLSLLILLLFLPSCRKPKTKIKNEITSYTIKENLDSIPLIISTEKGIKVLNLKTLKPIYAYPAKLKDFIETVFYNNKFYFICKNNIYSLESGKITKIGLPLEIRGITASTNDMILYSDSAVFELNKEENVTKLLNFKRSLNTIYMLPDLSSLIMVFHTNETDKLSKVSLFTKELTRETEVRDFVKLRISPFGKRIYVLTRKKFLFLDSKDLTSISEISLDAVGIDFVITASENKIFILTGEPEKIVTIRRATSKVISETHLSRIPEQVRITEDGGTIFFISEDTLYRFDTRNYKVVKKGSLEGKSDILSITQKGSRVIVGRKGGDYLEIINGNTLVPIKRIAFKSHLLEARCGIRPFRKTLREPSSVEPMALDTTAHKQGKPKNKLYTLQVSSSSISEGAIKLYKRIKMLSLPVYIDSSELKGKQKIYKVKIGAFEHKKDAEDFKQGINKTYNLKSWVIEGHIEPYIPGKSGFDINGDNNGEILLHLNNYILLFTNYEGIQKSVLKKNIADIEFTGEPISFKEGNLMILGIPFDEDSILAVAWIGNKYEIVKRKLPNR